MIAYLKESVPISSDTKKLMKVMEEMKDPLRSNFNMESFSLVLPDSNPCRWFRKTVKSDGGRDIEVLVYAFSLLLSSYPDGMKARIHIRIWSRLANETFGIGSPVIDAEGRDTFSSEYKKSVNASRTVREAVKKLSTESILSGIIKKTQILSSMLYRRGW